MRQLLQELRLCENLNSSRSSADKSFALDRPVITHCGGGGRAALAGKLLKDMGYQKVYNLGGLKDWVEAGGKVEK